MSPPPGRKIVVELTPHERGLNMRVMYDVEQLIGIDARTSVVLMVLRSLLSQLWPDAGKVDFK